MKAHCFKQHHTSQQRYQSARVVREVWCFLIIIVSLIGCNPDRTTTLVLRAVSGHYSATSKAYLDADNYLTWHSTDSVRINGTIYPLTATTTEATISNITPHHNNRYYAFYPATGYSGTWLDSSGEPCFTNITIPASTTYYEREGKQCLNAPMVATIDDPRTDLLRFRNVGMLFSITITNHFTHPLTLTTLRISCHSNNLAGQGFSVTDQGLQRTSPATDTTSTLILPNIPLAVGSSKTISISLPPTTQPDCYTFVATATHSNCTYTFTRRSSTISPIPANSIFHAPIDLNSQNYTMVQSRTNPFQGNGTLISPYLLQSSNDVALLSDLVNEGATAPNNLAQYDTAYYRFNTPALTLTNHTPIGTPSHPFCGHINGNHQGKNVRITLSATADQYVGLFGYCSNATIDNITIANATLTATSLTDIAYIGSICGYITGNKSCITYCFIDGNINIQSYDITLKHNFGGIVGCLDTLAQINCCKNDSNSTITTYNASAHFGGIVGKARMRSIITNCTNNATLTDNKPNNDHLDSYTSSITAYLQKESAVINSNNNGKIQSKNKLSCGVVGVIYTATIANCFSVYIDNNQHIRGELLGHLTTNDYNIDNCFYWGKSAVASMESTLGCTKAIIEPTNNIPRYYVDNPPASMRDPSITNQLNLWISSNAPNHYAIWSIAANGKPILTCFSN